MTPEETTAAVAAGVIVGVMVCAAAYFAFQGVTAVLEWVVTRIVIRIRAARAAR